jgi:hypothetical protein
MHVEYTVGDGKRMTSFVAYSKDHFNLKWKKICVRGYEFEIMKQLRKFRVPQIKKLTLARAMTYYPAYPGTSHGLIVKNGYERIGKRYEKNMEVQMNSTYLFKNFSQGSRVTHFI